MSSLTRNPKNLPVFFLALFAIVMSIHTGCSSGSSNIGESDSDIYYGYGYR